MQNQPTLRPVHFALLAAFGAAAALAATVALNAADAPAGGGGGGGSDGVMLATLDAWNARGGAEAKARWKLAKDAKVDQNDSKKLSAMDPGAAGGQAIVLTEPAHGADLVSRQEFGDGEYHCEFMVPKGSNSGLYIMGRYEVQILDSYGKPKERLGPGDVGGIYSTKGPSENASKPAGEWQSFDVVFRAPRFDASGKKTSNALFALVKLNGRTIHENVEAPKPTGSEIDSKEAPKGPIMLQGDHGPIAFRNVWVKPVAMRDQK
jgi:hypothetical protein